MEQKNKSKIIHAQISPPASAGLGADKSELQA